MQENGNGAAPQKMLTGLFPDRESTMKAYEELNKKGYTSNEINLIMSDETFNKHFPEGLDSEEKVSDIIHTAGRGSAIGGTIGALTGIVAAIATSFIIPGIGLLIAGPIAAGLAGAGTGAIAGGLIGSLIGSEIPEENIHLLESGIKNGQIVIGVHPKNPEDAVAIKNTLRIVKPEENY